MQLDSLFAIEICKNPISREFVNENPGETPYVTTTSENNGVDGYVNYPAQYPANVITVSKDGASADAFLQPAPFCGNEKVMVLQPKVKMSKNQLLYYTMVISFNKYKFAYGRKCSVERLKTLDIPSLQEIPIWCEEIEIVPLSTKNKSAISTEMKTDEWKEFKLNQIFTLKGGFYNKKPEHSNAGNIPFLASTENNNGVTEYYSWDDIYQWDKIGNEDHSIEKKLYQGNCIAVTVNGSVCNAFYQFKQFTCSHDITVFYLKGYTLNPSLAIFLCTIIMQDKYRWSYGRKPHDINKFGNSIIKLPIQRKQDGTPIVDDTHMYSENGYVPDWKFMEGYIKMLPFGDRI